MEARPIGAIIAVIVCMAASIAIVLYPRAKAALAPAPPPPMMATTMAMTPPAGIEFTQTVRTTAAATLVDVSLENQTGADQDVTISEATLNEILPKTKLPLSFKMAAGATKTVSLEFDARASSYGDNSYVQVEWSSGNSSGMRSMGSGSSQPTMGYTIDPADKASFVATVVGGYDSESVVTVEKILVDGKPAPIKRPLTRKVAAYGRENLPIIKMPKSYSGKSVNVQVFLKYKLNPLAQEKKTKELTYLDLP